MINITPLIKFCLFLILISNQSFSQYVFPDCYTEHIVGQVYNTGDKASLNGFNYEAKYYTTTTPPSADWTTLGACGDPVEAIGPEYGEEKRIIGYMPTWNTTYDFDTYDPTKITKNT